MTAKDTIQCGPPASFARLPYAARRATVTGPACDGAAGLALAHGLGCRPAQRVTAQRWRVPADLTASRAAPAHPATVGAHGATAGASSGTCGLISYGWQSQTTSSQPAAAPARPSASVGQRSPGGGVGLWGCGVVVMSSSVGPPLAPVGVWGCWGVLGKPRPQDAAEATRGPVVVSQLMSKTLIRLSSAMTRPRDSRCAPACSIFSATKGSRWA